MRRELLPLFGIAALFGSLTTLSVVLAVDPIDYPYEVHAVPRNDKALIYTPPAHYQAVPDCSEKCSQCLASDWSAAVTQPTASCQCTTPCRCPATEPTAIWSCDNSNCRQPVVVDLPELLGPTDDSAIDVIKRKLGINNFAGTIYENPPPLPPYSAGAWVADQIMYFPARPITPLFSQPNQHNYQLAGLGMNSEAGLIGDVYIDEDCPGSTPRGVAKTSYVTEEPECIECTVGIDALRNSGEDLDSAANQLERMERYEQADLLRNAAHELRHLARRLRQDGGAPSVSVAAPMPLGARFDVLSEDVKECAAEPPPPIRE